MTLKKQQHQRRLKAKEVAHTAMQRAERNYEVEEIFDRWVENIVVGYRVKWKGYSARHNAWELESALAGAVAAIARFEQKIKKPKKKS